MGPAFVLVPLVESTDQGLEELRLVWKNVAQTYGGVVDERLERARRMHPDFVVVWARPGDAVEGTCELRDFTHPPEAIYIFGPDHGPVPDPEAGEEVVTIETPHQGAALWSFVAMGIVLYDRHRKSLA